MPSYALHAIGVVKAEHREDELRRHRPRRDAGEHEEGTMEAILPQQLVVSRTECGAALVSSPPSHTHCSVLH